MKIKKLLILFLVGAFSVVTHLAGCVSYNALTAINGEWKYDRQSTDYHERIKAASLTIDGTDAYLYVEFADTVKEFSFETGNYKVEFGSVYSDLSVSGYLVSEKYEIRFETFGKSSGDELRLQTLMYTIAFSRAGSEASVPDPDPEKPDPEKPTPDTGASNFSAIRAAYQNAGYAVDLASDNSLDQSVKTLISTMQTQYLALGYELCFIGKNLDNLLGAELYMLIETQSGSEAEELNETFGGVYQTAQSGRDVMVYIWTLGSPDFSYFNQVVN